MSEFSIAQAQSEADLAAIAALFTAYTTWLNIDLTFQDFTTELASLPGKYSPPTGALLLARRTSDSEPLGCIALRPLPSSTEQDSTELLKTCELKRLYVAPSARGLGVGRALVKECLRIAREAGYREAKLDTLPHMRSAIRTYEAFGFLECERYYETPLGETRFMRVEL
jgi:ribosomal protein S18 acetylase RimI-like enzyme